MTGRTVIASICRKSLKLVQNQASILLAILNVSNTMKMIENDFKNGNKLVAMKA